ncbi:type II toxin-antitoxin system VapB family antitoxin [Sphingomonas sp. SUN019]|uniref:antitoxin n=1 Tax=Sphingomonas sp. SUN019 TaxID=2937788 RepID=UPI0021641D1F|nr:type II toxin-antitoxin system VapB family antitoxin [Sphingomonas sp. SUN019]UVO49585.1 type II toxin-antitoxin system VapB family antitoxin [Sphingomonas sp. SUN019]
MNDMAKIFWSGRSQAVRLPKEYRFEGEQVSIRREGDRVILEPVPKDGWAWLSRLQPMDSDAVQATLDRPGPEVMPDGPSFD